MLYISDAHKTVLSEEEEEMTCSQVMQRKNTEPQNDEDDVNPNKQ